MRNMLENISTTRFNSPDALRAAWLAIEGRFTAISRQIAESRSRVIEEAASHSLPNTRQEEWKYTSIRPLIDSGFELVAKESSAILDESLRLAVQKRLLPGSLGVVFVDGRYVAQWSSADQKDAVRIRSLRDAEVSEDVSWWDRWRLNLDSSKVFWKISLGLSTDGVVLELGEGCSQGRPIHILHVATEKMGKVAANNRVLINVAKGAAVSVFEEFASLETATTHEGAWTNVLTQIRLGQSAKCGYYRILSEEGSYHTGAVTANLDQASRLELLSLSAGAKLARIDVDVTHYAAESECVLNGLYLVKGSEHIDHHTCSDHLVGNTKTYQLFKGILSDAGRAVFNGKIFIRKDAQKAEAYQTSKNLLLSGTAEVDAKPQLEIDADDVKASHGAAIGSLDRDELFYLQSRCIDRAEATAILCRGFAADVILRLDNEFARKVLMARIDAWFSNLAANYPGKMTS